MVGLAPLQDNMLQGPIPTTMRLLSALEHLNLGTSETDSNLCVRYWAIKNKYKWDPRIKVHHGQGHAKKSKMRARDTAQGGKSFQGCDVPPPWGLKSLF